jgi:hypothetical protein
MKQGSRMYGNYLGAAVVAYFNGNAKEVGKALATKESRSVSNLATILGMNIRLVRLINKLALLGFSESEIGEALKSADNSVSPPRAIVPCAIKQHRHLKFREGGAL